MSQKNFAITPSVSISRSKFRRPSQHKTSFVLGKLVPIYLDLDILPGDTVSLDLAALVRMSTPIAPIMDNIFIDYYAFFVPNRLVWDKWKQFMGENDSGAGTSSYVAPHMPVIDINQNVDSSGAITTGTLGDYLGLPVGCDVPYTYVSALPARGYALIYNEWFRDQNIIEPMIISTDSTDTGFINPADGQDFGYDSDLFSVCKESDYFTRSLPYAQKGAPVTLPLGDYAPLIAHVDANSASIYHDFGNPVNFAVKSNGVYTKVVSETLGLMSTGKLGSGDTAPSAIAGLDATNLVADLSKATAATINQLRFAFQYQKFLEKDALYGTRYWEILKGHFGITAPDASLQRPELLGHFRQHINIDQVLQTSASSTTALGTPGANSVSGKSDHLISKSFVEHGMLFIFAVARHDQTYGQGINRMWTRTKRENYYFPVFANLGAQEILSKEIFAYLSTGSVDKTNTVFGYQEAWAEYRYKPSIVTGLLNPHVTGSLSYWNLANNFGTAPTLSETFIHQDRDNLSRALTTGNSGPDFIADFYFDAVYVRPMPMYSIPGLIDHH